MPLDAERMSNFARRHDWPARLVPFAQKSADQLRIALCAGALAELNIVLKTESNMPSRVSGREQDILFRWAKTACRPGKFCQQSGGEKCLQFRQAAIS